MEDLIDKATAEETKSLVVQTEKLISGFKINSQPTLEKANKFLVEITQAEKKVIDREREILNHLNKSKQSIIDFFRPLKIRFAELKLSVKQEIAHYITELEKKEIAKKAEIEEKVASGKMDIDKAFEKIQKFEERKDTVIVREERIVEIVDENKLPDKYWYVDTVLVRKDALAGILGVKEGVRITIKKNIIGKGI